MDTSIGILSQRAEDKYIIKSRYVPIELPPKLTDTVLIAMVCSLIEEWKNDFFHPLSLKELGLRIQLGHGVRECCTIPLSGHKDFVVLLWNRDKHLQLMEMRWWPTSYKEPQTAVTSQLLRNFHITNLQAQIALTDFQQVLKQMTDGTGLAKLPDHVVQFLLILCQWCNVKMLKHCGQEHDPDCVGTT
ncbi:hypothetical protein PM082_018325 [Marasmius tenuissimus]|nr:hypothetical protein PM082_018325 [Marasmius tenuissimus]